MRVFTTVPAIWQLASLRAVKNPNQINDLDRICEKITVKIVI
jgi:hypothetical protein